jgi:hypothetical protein
MKTVETAILILGSATVRSISRSQCYEERSLFRGGAVVGRVDTAPLRFIKQ